MSSVYGSDMQGFSSRGFIWAAETDFSLVAPQATISANVYTGSILLSQLQGTNSVTGPTYRDLIEIAGKSTTMKEGRFTLRSAMINNNLVFSQQPVGTTLDDPAFSGEVINYAIIEKGAQSLTGAGN